MQNALKKQADTYFQSISDLEKTHQQLAKVGELPKFYTLLISKYLQPKQLTSKIVSLHTNKLIDWRLFIDAIWGYSLCLTEDSESFKALSQFVGQIDRKNIVERSYLMKSLPQNLIDSANLQKKQVLEKQTQRAFRKLYFDQKKHNLLRENNEGFAKLCLLLATLTPKHSIETVWNKILSLIGNFDLDPDRVLDLLIETFVQSANSQVCLNLIKNFNPQSIVALIGNRIVKDCSPDISQKITYAGKVQSFLTGQPDELYKDISNLINPKLIILLCKLIKQKVIDIQTVLPYLNPQNNVFEAIQAKRLQNGRQKILKSFKLVMQQQTQQQIAKIKEQQNFKFLGQMLYSSKLALFNGFVRANDWENFTKYWNQYHTKIDLLLYQPLLKSLLEMLEWIIQPLYDKISYKNKYFKNKNHNQNYLKAAPSLSTSEMEDENKKQMTQISELNEKQFNKIIQLFDMIKIYIGFHSRIFIKICRLFMNIIKQPTIFGLQKPNESMPIQNSYTIIKQKIQFILQYYLFPGVSLQTSNSALTKEIYQLLEFYDYRFRYKCYLHHYSEGMIMNPYLAHIFYKTRNKQIVIVNNLSDKNKKIFMKKIAKLTHNQALQTFYWIFRRILLQDYEKVVPQIVAVLSTCCTLTLEMSIFVALHILNEQKQPAMNFKTGEQYPWFKNIINFISLFYRKYLQIDIQPVFDYIIMKIGQPVQQLQENQELPGSLLKLLHEILSKMFCNFILKQINKGKLEMLCAGPRLQLQAMDISQQIKASKKSKVILQKFFWGKSVDQYDGQSLAISLLVLLTQKRAQLLHKSYISNIKIIGDIYDDFTVIIIQLIRVLNQLSSGYVQYAKLLPQNALNLLINEYKLPLQIAFEIYRPSIKHISDMTNDEWNIFVNYVGGVINKYISTDQKYINRYEDNDKLKAYLNQNYEKMTNVMSNQFFAAFWMLTLDSIYFPAKLYAEKIEEVKKKAQIKPNRGSQRNDKTERQIEKARILLLNLKNQQGQQQKKVQDTTNQTNMNKLKVEYLKNGPKDDKSASIAIQQFAQIFVQICLLPRMMLDPEEALYCMKITMEVIKFNKLSSGKSIKLLIYIIEHVMNYLPYSTERQAAYCLAIFLSEMLSIVSNWNDSQKLKQDMKKFLGIDETFIEQNYPRLKKQFLKLYIRFGNLIKSIKDEPYSIRNCLFLLQKVDSIPAYKKQAQDLQNYLKLLKEKYSMILPTIIEMQLSIIGQKKKTLPIVEQQGQLLSIKNQGQRVIAYKSPIRTKFEQIQKSIGEQIINKQVQNNEKNDEKKKQMKQTIKQTIKPIQIQINNPQQQKRSQKQKISHNKTPIQNQIQISIIEKPEIQIQLADKHFSNGHQKNITQQVKQIQILEKKQQKNSPIDQSVILLGPINQTRIQTVAEKKKVQQQRVQKINEKPASENKAEQTGQRIKTVKQLRDQNARKSGHNIVPSAIQQPHKQIQPQLTQKLKKQSFKDPVPPKNQRLQWNKQEQKKDKQKVFQPTVEFGPKISQDQKKNLTQINRSKTPVHLEEMKPQKNSEPIIEKKSLQLNIEQPSIEMRPKLTKDQSVQILNPPYKGLQKQQIYNRPREHHSKSRDKNPESNHQKIRDNRIEWTNKNQKQDRFSQERNQAKQRQYKRDNRPYEKRDKDQRPPIESRWKEREDYRDNKFNEDRNQKYPKDQKDRMRRKQDKYDRQKDRERGRKHDGKGKERSRDRQRDYRK